MVGEEEVEDGKAGEEVEERKRVQFQVQTGSSQSTNRK
jgi:hypothetical protein